MSGSIASVVSALREDLPGEFLRERYVDGEGFAGRVSLPPAIALDPRQPSPLERIELQLANLAHRQQEMARIVQQRPKSELQVEAPGGIVESIDFHGPNANLF